LAKHLNSGAAIMSETRLVVREPGRDWSGNIHASCADRAIAALSAGPTTMDELEAAVARFAKKDPDCRYFVNLSRGLHDEPYDAGLVVIDLVAQLIVVESTYSSPGMDGDIAYHNGRAATDAYVRYHLADDWLISSDADCWRDLAEKRRRDRAAKPLLDARAVFYGRPLLEFIAREVFAAFARRDEIATAVRVVWAERAQKRLADKVGVAPAQIEPASLSDEAITPKTWPGQEEYGSPFYDTLKEIHAAWLLTPRADLGGACPRAVAQEQRNHLTWDLQDRCQQWSMMRRCPPGLDKSSHAYRYGGFGIHELVLYYEMVRELLWSCWDGLEAQANGPGFGALTVGDFLATEVERLEKARDHWLDSPGEDCHGHTPRSVIERERARLPEGMSGREAMHDPDCPCCQMMADLPGVGFWHLDGCNMDEGFAFDIYRRTREEWDDEERKREEWDRRFEAERKERERLGITNSMSPEPGSVWSRSFNVADTADVPFGIRVFGVGCRLAELIVGLRAGCDRDNVPAEAQQHIDQLNRDFGNLREILATNDSSLALALVDPVLDRFAETLATVATARPDLAEQCESLTEEVRELLEPPPEEPEGRPDFGLPF
jgi:hypothetical protein